MFSYDAAESVTKAVWWKVYLSSENAVQIHGMKAAQVIQASSPVLHTIEILTTNCFIRV